jgi:hypothetical protein
MKKVVIFLFIGWIGSISLVAQDSRDSEDIIEGLFKLQDDLTYEEFYESITPYLSNPLDLNKAEYEDLEKLLILTPIQINNFLGYRFKAGKIISLYELQVIEGFDLTAILHLLPFVTIRNEDSYRNLWNRIQHNKNIYLLTKFDPAIHSTTSNKDQYLGDGNRIILRYRNYQTNDFSFGVTMKKDAGEPIKFNLKKEYFLFDETSFHAAVYNQKRIKTILLGDYQLQFGQGLVLGGGMYLGKGAETILTAKKMGSGIRPHTSTSEYGYFRGVAFAYSYDKIHHTIFFSHQGIDGRVDSTNNTFTKITTGYHRSDQELLNRKNRMENVIGSYLSLNPSHNSQFGLTIVNTSYDKTLSHSSTLYNRFAFSGATNFTAGLDFNFSLKNFILFGEGALSKNGGYGLVTGFLSSISSKLETAVVVRNYQKNFHSLYGNAFRENTSTINESGVYLGLKYKVNSKIVGSFYYDRFKFPWLKYQVDAPSQGYEYFTRITYTPSKNSLIYFQYRLENKEQNADSTTSWTALVLPRIKKNYLLTFETQTGKLKLRSRVQYSSTGTISTTSGLAMIQDIEFTCTRILVAARFSVFDTDFDNRQYVYERNMTYSFSIPFYYGQGYRWYVLTKLKFQKYMDLWLRIASTKRKTNTDDLFSSFTNGYEISGMIMFKL